jgi:hypothetical protein
MMTSTWIDEMDGLQCLIHAADRSPRTMCSRSERSEGLRQRKLLATKAHTS